MRKIFKFFLFAILSFYCSISFADKVKEIDSLKVLLSKVNEAKRGGLYFKIASLYGSSDTINFNINITKALEYSDKFGSLELKGKSYALIGRNFHAFGNFEKAKFYFTESFKLSKQSGNQSDIAESYSNLGNINYFMSNFDLALHNYFLELNIREKLKDKSGTASIYINIGNAYFALGEKKKSLYFQKMAFDYFKEIKDEYRMAVSLVNLAELYDGFNNQNKAIECYNQGLYLLQKLKDDYGIGLVKMNLGALYAKMNRYKEALHYTFEALDIQLKLNDPFQIANCYVIIGSTYQKMGQYDNALEYTNKSYQLAKEIQTRTLLKHTLQTFVDIYKSMGDYKMAFEKQLAYDAVVDSINTRETTDRVAEITGKYESGKKEEQILSLEKDKKIQKLEIAKSAADIRRQRYILALVGGILILMVLFLFSMYKSNLQRKRANAKLQNAYNVIEEKKKEILDSITYAKRLQDAILPPQDFVSSHFKENFILYLPKDIVAGDFYWMEESNGITFIAAADSTGHGVPGAMVSVVCSNALNRAVNEFKLSSPGSILDKTRDLVLETFGKASNDVKDGMDISLLCYDKNDKKVFWSGANNPLWYFDSGALKKIVANKQPIGKTDSPNPFTTHEILASKGTTFYLFTDGFADQFGGSKGKKFKYRQLEDFLLRNAGDSMELQRKKLGEEFEHWKGDLEQVDDVCIIGIRI